MGLVSVREKRLFVEDEFRKIHNELDNVFEAAFLETVDGKAGTDSVRYMADLGQAFGQSRDGLGSISSEFNRVKSELLPYRLYDAFASTYLEDRHTAAGGFANVVLNEVNEIFFREKSYYQAMGVLAGCKAVGAAEYVFVMCDLCKRMSNSVTDGDRVLVGNARSGVNFPPLRVGCECGIMEYVPPPPPPEIPWWWDENIREIIIPNFIEERLNGEKRILYPKITWLSYQRGRSQAYIPIKNQEGRYRIVVGPRVINPHYPDGGRIWINVDGLNFPVRIDAVLSHITTGQQKIIGCITESGAKAHTFNNYPDSLQDHNVRHPRNEKFRNDIFMRIINGDTGMTLDSGLIQTGIAYPNSANAGQNHSDPQLSMINRDASTIEFDCRDGDLDFNPWEYSLEKIIVL